MDSDIVDRVCARLGLTQKALAQKAGVNPSRISDVKSGRLHGFSRRDTERFVKAFPDHFTVKDLIFFERVTGDDIGALAGKKKVDPEKLSLAVAEQKVKAKPAKTAEAGKKNAAERAAEKLVAAGVTREDDARLDEAAKDLGIPVDEIVSAVEEVIAEQKKADGAKPEKK